MTTHDETPRRKRPVHGFFPKRDDVNVVYVTANAKGREPWLANEAVHAALRAVWLCSREWRVGQYVIMPDHIHFFAAEGGPDIELEAWMGYVKRMVSRSVQIPGGKWQDSQWDTRMRTVKQFQEKWLYVRENPVRKGLVTCPDDWPYQGYIFPDV